jgi:phage tail-like protein
VPPTAELPDPFLAFRFGVEVEGVLLAGFGELSGLEAKTDVFEYMEGGLNTHSHKLPGRTTFSNIVLKHGSSSYATELWKWYHELATATKTADQKKSVSIVHYSAEHEEVRRWNLTGAFPVKWTGPSFNAAQSAVAIETLELAYAEFEFVTRK